MKTIMASILTMLILLCCSTSVFASDINLKEGMWKITTTMEIPGMPHKMPGGTFTQCLTKQDVTPPVHQNDNCTISDTNISNNTVSYKMVCTQDGETSSGSGTFIYAGDKMTGKMEINANDMNIITRYTGAWVGPCK